MNKEDDFTKHQDINLDDSKVKKIGFYTQPERLLRIKKYKQKIKKWLTKKKASKSSPKSPLLPDDKIDSKETEAKAPEKAEFGDLNYQSVNPIATNSQSCFRQFMPDFASSPGGQNLNDIVAQLSGFN